jgi:hypothetical protein
MMSFKRLKSLRLESMVSLRIVLLFSLAGILTGCGSDTAWYVCSGSAEFCGINPPDKDDDKPLTISAVEVSRSTPQAIENDLPADGLAEVLGKSPELVAGWLLAGSLGVLSDDSDNAAVSRFLDNNRYWLAVNEDRTLAADKALIAGLELLGYVAASRDPELAGEAVGKAEKLVTLIQVDTVARNTVTPQNDVNGLASQVLGGYSADDCCSTAQLMAAAVILCDSAELPAVAEVENACAAARRWLLDDSN